MIALTDLIVRCPPALHQQHCPFPDDSRLFLEVFFTENKTERIGPLVKQSASSWKVPGNIDVPASVSLIKITVLLEYSGQGYSQLGSTELVSDHLFARCMGHDNTEVAQTLVTTGNNPALEILSSCFASPSKDRGDIVHPEGATQRGTVPAVVLELEYENALLCPDEDPAKPTSLWLVAHQLARRFFQSKNKIHLDNAISALDSATKLMPVGHPLRGRSLGVLGSLLLVHDEHSTTLSDLDRAVSSLELCEMPTPEGDGNLMDGVGVAFRSRFERLGGPANIDKAISAHKDAVCLTPEGHTNKPRHLSNLGTSCQCRFEHSGELVDIDEAISAHKDAVRLTPEGHADKPGRLNDLGNSFTSRFDHSGELADIDKAISAHKDAVRLTAEGHADKPGRLNNLGNSFMRLFQHSGELVNINEAISAHKNAVRLTPEGHANMPSRLSNLGLSLKCRFERSGELVDIKDAISAHKHAVCLTPEGHTSKPRHLSNLGISYQCCFEHSGELVDIDAAISAHKNAVCLTPEGHTNKPSCLSNLGLSLMRRFEHSGELVDIKDAISALEDAVCLTPEGHTDKPVCLNNLGVAFMSRFEHSGELVDIEEAISAHRDAVHLTPEGHSDKPGHLSNLGNSFMRRFEHSGELVDIDEAISAHRNAVCLTPEGHADKPGRLSNLGSSFRRRFEHSRELVDIEEVISAHKDAVSLTPEGHADKPGRLNNLGVAFMCRFEHSGELVDINEGISAHKNAVRLTVEGHANKPGRLNNLGNSFMRLFQRSGELVNIDEAILAHKNAVRLTPEGHANKPNRLSNLGLSLMRRFQRSGELGDIEDAISALKDAVRLIPEGHANKPVCLDNLGNSFRCRFEHSGELVDINEAISAHKDAVRLTPEGNADKDGYLTSLGISFTKRFEHSRDLIDIEDAISALKDAIHLIPQGHTHKPVCLSSLGYSLMRRFEHSGQLVDINEAILAHEDAVHLTPEGHAAKPGCLINLGNSFLCRFKSLGNSLDVDRAIEQFQLSASSSAGDPLLRFDAALQWARLTSENRPVTSLDGYGVAVNLLHRVVWLGQTISVRHTALASTGELATEAAAAAIRQGKFGTALEWLEQGRSIVWGQLLNLRNPMHELRIEQPDLAEDFARVSRELEKAGFRGSDFTSSHEQLSLEEAAQRHRRLAEEWDSLVEKARALPGFHDFLRPKRLETLAKAAQTGPVITINVHELRCDALILIPGRVDVIHVPLESFSYARALELRHSLRQSLLAANVRMRDIRGTQLVPRRGDDHGFGGILSALWLEAVKPVVDFLAFPVSTATDPPRIWWCPTGPLSFLPIHAAGLYHTNAPGSKVSDFVTSSYTPTLTVLLERSRISPKAFQGLLGVNQPCTPGLSRLPNAAKELTHIENLGSSLQIHSLPAELATVQRVVEGMRERSWVHFACHAVQDISEPIQSAFCLHDGRLSLSRIISNSFPHADFAFLSACQTATGDEKLSEEVVHLAAGMLAAGYRSVIATMWSIKDDDAPLISREVYPRLICGPSPDSSRAAHALHHAVKHLREELEKSGEPSFLSWVPFIHVGI